MLFAIKNVEETLKKKKCLNQRKSFFSTKKTLLHFFSFTILEVSGAYQFRTAKNGLTFLRDFACVTSNPH